MGIFLVTCYGICTSLYCKCLCSVKVWRGTSFCSLACKFTLNVSSHFSQTGPFYFNQVHLVLIWCENRPPTMSTQVTEWQDSDLQDSVLSKDICCMIYSGMHQCFVNQSINDSHNTLYIQSMYTQRTVQRVHTKISEQAELLFYLHYS